VKPHGYIYVDWAGIPSKRKSTIGGFFSIASVTISWYIRKQSSIALSLTE